MLDYLPAITLHRPHPWAIFHPPKKPKDHENRGYALPEKYLGEWVAMHAGKRYNEVAAADMRVAGYGP
ncbi:MAG: hypothetical protein KAJ19_18905, partial [Gammaproteobacteria bacterium]|nr:hypothetical protein [Gammaproteobacteria bacterium]